MCRKSALFLITISFPLCLLSQEMKPLQDIFIDAEYFFMNGDYPDALLYYLQIYGKLPENANIAYRIGDCYLNINGKKNLSTEYLEAATKNM